MHVGVLAVPQQATACAHLPGLARPCRTPTDQRTHRAGRIEELPAQRLARMDDTILSVEQQQLEPAPPQVVRPHTDVLLDGDGGLQHAIERAVAPHRRGNRDQRLAAVEPRPVGIRDVRTPSLADGEEPFAVSHPFAGKRGRPSVRRAGRDDVAFAVGRQRAQHRRVRTQELAEFLVERSPGPHRPVGHQLDAGELALQEVVDRIGAELRVGAQPELEVVLVALPLAP